MGNWAWLIAKEMRYWLVCIGVILGLSVFGRKLQIMLLTRLDMIWVAVVVYVLISGALLFLYKNRADFAIARRTLFGVTFLLFTSASAVYFKLLAPVETLHFLVFSCYGWLSATVFGPLYGVVVVLGMGVGDEVLQHFLPDRIGDVHDIAINTLSGLVGILLRGNQH